MPGTPPLRPLLAALVSCAFASACAHAVRPEAAAPAGPRPVTRAIPESANGALYLPQVSGDLEATVDFVERLLGPDSLQRFLDATLLPSVALERSNTEQGVAGDQGLGVFTLSDFKGLVGLIGATDKDRVVGAVVQRLSAKGGVPRQEPDGTVRVRMDEGREIAIFDDRGYVYVAIPDATESGPGASATLAIEAVRRSKESGLGTSGRLRALEEKVTPGNVYVYFELTSASDPRIDAVFASVKLGQSEAVLDGFLHGPGPLWDARSAPLTTLLSRAPQGWVAAGSASVPPSELKPILRLLLSGGRSFGFNSATEDDVTLLTGALGGDLGLLVYFDAGTFLEKLTQSAMRPEPRGSVLVRAGIRDRAALDHWIQTRLDARELTYQRDLVADSVRYRVRIGEDQSAVVTIAPQKLDLQAGDPLGDRPSTDAMAALRQRFGEGAFAPGHLSLMADLGELLRELETPRQVSGVPADRISMVQGFAAAFVRQLTPIDHGFADISPDPEGARLRAVLTLRPH